MGTRRKSNRKCDHQEAVVTVTAGIERTTCMACGEVRIRYDHTTCTEWPGNTSVDEPRLVGVAQA